MIVHDEYTAARTMSTLGQHKPQFNMEGRRMPRLDEARLDESFLIGRITVRRPISVSSRVYHWPGRR